MREKVILLVPLRFNDGTIIPQSTLNDLFDEVYILAGGYTIAGQNEGTYRMQETGQKQVDVTLEIWVALEPDLVVGLEAIVRKYCVILGQECMYFERTGAKVDFLFPGEPDVGGQP